MISAWTDHLKTDEEKQQFKNQVLGSKQVFKRLQELINRIEDDLNNAELDTRIYDNPNWEYRQADMNGSRRTLRTIRKLITTEP